MQRLNRLLTFCAAVALVAACGNSTDGESAPPGAPAAIAPVITQQPASAAVTEGQPASFAVTATGTDPLVYQWQRDGVDIAGADAASYTIAATSLGDSGATFRARVSNSAGSAASDNASLTVNAASAWPATLDYVKASNTGAQDLFGVGVALSGDGNFLAVGACCEDSSASGVDGDQNNNALVQSGAVYIFRRTAGVWSQHAYLKASNPGAGDNFGYSLALSFEGNTLVIGAPEEDSSATGVNGNGADDGAADSGAAYVFVRDGNTWSQQAYLKASNTGPSDDFGRAVAISPDGNTVTVAAPNESSDATGIDGNGGSDAAAESGAVYVFARSGAAWSQQAYVKASNTGAGDLFGSSVSLSGDGLLAVGARREDSSATGAGGNQADDGTFNSGAAYVFGRNLQNVWVQVAYLKASNTGVNDQFGVSVALSPSGNTLAVGANREASAATGVEGDQASNAADQSGAVYVFVRNGNTWSQQAYVKASNTGIGDSFGFSVALSGDGNRLAVSAAGERSSATGVGGDQSSNSASLSGAAYIFVRNGSTWTQLAYVKASNTDAEDFFGWQVALSHDGLTLAVGAPQEDGAATGINGDAASNAASGAGAVYLYY